MSATTNGTYDWNGQLLSDAGTYSQHYRTSEGCDSVIILTLSTINVPDPQIVNYADRMLMINHFPRGVDSARVDYYAYRWYRNDELIEGATNDTYQKDDWSLLGGCFFVKAAADEGLTIWLRSNLICIAPMGIDNATSNQAVKIYPNPLRQGETLNIETPREAQVVIYDQQGRVVASANGSQRVRLQGGIYMVRVGNNVATKVVVR